MVGFLGVSLVPSTETCGKIDIEPKKLIEALKKQGWIIAMQEELNQFGRNKVWMFVLVPHGKTIIGTKWIWKNKMDEHEVVVKNKARLVAQGYNQVYQMDVKSAFLNKKISKDHTLKGGIKLHFVPIDLLLADIFTKPLAEPSFTRLVAELAEADSTTNTISFTLSSFDEPLSFNIDEFSTVIDLKTSENCVSLPPKETVKASLATLGLIGLDIDISKILFFDLHVQLNPRKKERKPNVCYTRYLSLIIKHLLGDNCNNNNLKTLKHHHITASYFKTPSASEVPLTSHMLKVAKVYEEQYQSSIISSGKVNTDDSTNKSLSENNVQPDRGSSKLESVKEIVFVVESASAVYQNSRRAILLLKFMIPSSHSKFTFHVEKSSSSSDETIAEVSYYISESESESEFETLEYYDHSTNYGLFVENCDDQEIFHDSSEIFLKIILDLKWIMITQQLIIMIRKKRLS
nr:copia protein [Tanacetum cinerariifolium]